MTSEGQAGQAVQRSPRRRGSSWGRLPADLFQDALEYLPAGALKRVAAVCRLWNSYTKTNRRLARILELHGLIAVGGWDGETELSTADFYSPSRDQWVPLPPMREKRSHVGCAVVDRQLYVIGGRDDERRLATAERYDPLTGEWHSLPPMTKNRSSLALRAVGRHLFAFGGYDGTREQMTNESFDIDAGVWRQICPLGSPRSQMASAVLDHHIYLFGGCDDVGDRILKTAQRYNVLTNCFEPLPDMYEQRLSAAAAVLDGMVYVLGGSSGQHTHQSVECFDPRCNVWVRAADLTLMRVNLAVTAFDSSLIVVGGFHTQLNQLSCVERFFPLTHDLYERTLLSAPGGRKGDGPSQVPQGVVPVSAPAGSHAPGGLWKVCSSLSGARDAVNVCIFE